MKTNQRFTSFLLLSVLLLLSGCSPSLEQPSTQSTAALSVISPSGDAGEMADRGQAYVDRFVFLGESTTYHMKSRGVLRGGTATTQVWGPKSGTICLDEGIRSLRLYCWETQTERSLQEALTKEPPAYILLNFGLNGVVKKYTRGADYYKACYQKLIGLIRQTSPNTQIFLSSCYPVGANMDVTHYSVDAATINQYLNTLSQWCRELAATEGLGYLDFAPLLKDEQGFLRADYQVGDGIHLTREAYLTVLQYIRTHDGTTT